MGFKVRNKAPHVGKPQEWAKYPYAVHYGKGYTDGYGIHNRNGSGFGFSEGYGFGYIDGSGMGASAEAELFLEEEGQDR